MRKWVYLVIGAVLALNAVLATFGVLVGSLPAFVWAFQAGWGILGGYLIYRSVCRFKMKKASAIEAR